LVHQSKFTEQRNPLPSGAVSGELTDRQREVVQLAAEGRCIRTVAVILEISGKTVTFHKSKVIRRLGIRATAELTKCALEHGITGS
jgi:DNA-binding NarL/FixJ family response regulator